LQRPLEFGHSAVARRAKTEQPRASALGRSPRENRPERAAEWRASFSEITFVESDSMTFQKLTKLFLIRKFAVMLGLSGNVGGDSLYVRLAH
jgi:hypothetical protein